MDNAIGPSRLFIKPIRNDVSKNVLYYTPTTGEITYGQAGSAPGGLDLSCNPIIDVSRVTFCDDIIIDTLAAGIAIDPNIVIGQEAGNDGSNNIAIGNDAHTGTGLENISIGNIAGNSAATGSSRICIGRNTAFAGGPDRNGNIAIGHQAGASFIGDYTIAIGYQSNGIMSQREGSISIGHDTGTSQTTREQGQYSIALGGRAGQSDICDNSIIINATGLALNNAIGSSRLFIKPIRNDVSKNVLYYTPTTGEITYGQAGSVPGGLDLSCNPIIDVSYIEWCDGTYIGPGSSFDISTNEVLKINVKDASNALVVDQSGNILLGTDTSLPGGTPSYLYFKGRGVSGEAGPYISIGGNASGNPDYQSVINLLTKGTFTTPSLTSTTKGWHIVAKGDAYTGGVGNMLSFDFKNEQSNYISGLHIAGQSPAGATIDYSGAEVGIGAVPIPGVSLFIDPSNNRGGGGAKTLGAIRIGPVGDVDTGELQFMERAGSTNYVGFKAPNSIPANVVWKLPNTDGAPSSFLKTNGAGQLSWGPAAVDPFDLSCNSITDVSFINFCGHNSVGIDLSCNTIIDISGLYFCDGTFIGHGNSFDISTNEVFKIRTTDISNALVVDQSGYVGINTPDPSYNLDVHRSGYGDILRLRNTSLSAGADINLLIGGTTVIGTYLNSAATATWPGGTPLFLRSGGTNVVTIQPPNATFPSAFDLTSEKLTIGGVEGTAGQVVKAKGDGLGGIEWGTGGGGDSSGNAAIPYEPWNLDVVLADTAATSTDVYYVQFFAPSTASYTQMTIYIGGNTANSYTGTIYTGIYSNTPGSPGLPGTLLAQGSSSISSSNIDKTYQTFDLSGGADLSANSLYWAAIGHQSGDQLSIVEHIDYIPSTMVVLRQTAGIGGSGLPTTAAGVSTGSPLLPYWFRIYNENASFGGGGPPGSTDLSGIPHQMAFFNTSTQLVGTPLAEVSGNQVLFADGISGEPIIAFLNHQTDGIFYEPTMGPTSGPGLAIVASGIERLHVGSSNVVVPNSNFICSGGQVRTTLPAPGGGLDGNIWAFGGGQHL